LTAVRKLHPIAHQAGLSLAQLALAWVLRKKEVTAAIIGATKPEQVKENAAASGKTLPDDVLAAIDRVLKPVAQVH
jgi:aryl-alcohol dehydrogenase-like predicted oxidoreductase